MILPKFSDSYLLEWLPNGGHSVTFMDIPFLQVIAIIVDFDASAAPGDVYSGLIEQLQKQGDFYQRRFATGLAIVYWL